MFSSSPVHCIPAQSDCRKKGLGSSVEPGEVALAGLLGLLLAELIEEGLRLLLPPGDGLVVVTVAPIRPLLLVAVVMLVPILPLLLMPLPLSTATLPIAVAPIAIAPPVAPKYVGLALHLLRRRLPSYPCRLLRRH